MARSSSLLTGWPPRWLNREEAADNCGMSPVHFDAQVRAGILPQPRVLNRSLYYDRHELDEAMLKLPRRGPKGTTDDDCPEPEV
jgi:hypothetical protein